MRFVRKGLAFALFLLAGGLAPALAAPVQLRGEVAYGEPIDLPPQAVLTVRLVDLTAPGDRPRIEARAPISARGEAPLTFTLDFDDRVIVPGHRYALSAEIISGGAVWFRNTEPYAIDPLDPVLPIAVRLTFAGRITNPGALAETPVIVDVIWRAETLDGKTMLPNAETSLSIAGDFRAGGRGGCNNYFAQARLTGYGLVFSAVAATRIACSPETTRQELAFFAALGATRSWRVVDGKLHLLDASGRELLVFARSPG